MNARIKEGSVARPEDVGFDSGRLKHVGDRIAADIGAERYDGARLLVARRGIPVLDLTIGFAERAASRPMAEDSLFSIMSISKVMTAVALLQKVERGDVSLLSPVASIIPEFAQRGKERITVYQLLTHTAGMSMGPAPLPVEKLGDLQECAKAICGLAPESTPGETVAYSASQGFTILGEIIRRVDGGKRRYGEILKQDVFDPLGMKDTHVGFPPRLAARRVPVVVRDLDSPELNPKFQADRDASVTEKTELPSGGATFSTAGDILRFAEALRLGRRAGGRARAVAGNGAGDAPEPHRRAAQRHVQYFARAARHAGVAGLSWPGAVPARHRQFPEPHRVARLAGHASAAGAWARWVSGPIRSAKSASSC